MIHNFHGMRKIKPSDKLLVQLQELNRETAKGNVEWEILYSTTEYNQLAEKKTRTIEGETYTVDECFVSYFTHYYPTDFLLITYEEILTGPTETKTTNLVFQPPLGIRYLDLDALASYAIDADQILIYQIHQLWTTILERKKNQAPEIHLEAETRI